MKSKLIILLLSSLSFVFASDYDNKKILSSAYNSIGVAVTESFGDVEGSGIGYTISYKPTPINIIFNYALVEADYDDILGTNISDFSFEGKGDSFQLGFLMESDDNSSHFIPFISMGTTEVSLENYRIESDATSFGFLYRALVSANTVFNLGLAFVDIDDTSIPADTRANINNDYGYNFSDADFDSAERLFTDESTTIVSLGLEHHVTENMIIDYGLGTDFDSTSLSFGIGLNY
jgi:hypothetical protein